MIETNDMGTKILLSKDFCEMDAIRYVASRYSTTPELVLKHYLMQTGILKQTTRSTDDYDLTPNELALFCDLGVHTSEIEIQ